MWKVIWLENPGNCLGVNDWFPAKGPVSGKWLPMFFSFPQPPFPDEYLDIVTFVVVIRFIVPISGCFLGFNHHLQEIYPALRRKAGEFLWWQVLQGGFAQTASSAQALLLNGRYHPDAHGFLVVKHDTCFLFQKPTCPFHESIGWESNLSSEFQERHLHSKRESFVGKHLLCLKSERGRHRSGRQHCCPVLLHCLLCFPLSSY